MTRPMHSAMASDAGSDAAAALPVALDADTARSISSLARGASAAIVTEAQRASSALRGVEGAYMFVFGGLGWIYIGCIGGKRLEGADGRARRAKWGLCSFACAMRKEVSSFRAAHSITGNTSSYLEVEPASPRLLACSLSRWVVKQEEY
jgi:hypothetical protein